MVVRRAKARSWLLSMLIQRYAARREQFLQEHPNPWLIWERGVWRPPAVDETTAVATSTVQEARALSEGTDLLCFELTGAGMDVSFRIGREPGCDVIINDATVSRTHVALAVDARSTWSFEVAPGSRVVARGRPVSAGTPTALTTGDQLKLGDVLLTFSLATEMARRLDAEAAGR